jgi:aminoglycoside phosphotransferase
VSITVASSAEHTRRQIALAACGLDRDLAMTRGSSYANEVWLGDDVVLRINTRGAGTLAREASIARRISRDAKLPEILEVGHDDEIEWMLSRRVRGIDLGHAWPAMTMVQRERAIRQLADALAAVHATETAGIPDDIRPPHTLPIEPMIELIERVIDDTQICAMATHFTITRWGAFDGADRGLVHGDPHLENALWDGTNLSALLDLEWSRPSWIHADLEILLALADAPAEFASADREHAVVAEHYAEIPRWLRAARPDWFAHPRLVERLEVLALSRLLGHFEDDPAAADSFGRWEHVASVLAGEGSARRLCS